MVQTTTSTQANVTWSKKFKYTADIVKAQVPQAAGVYVIWVQMKDDSLQCRYVGQASDLRQRLLEHLASNEPNKCLNELVHKYVVGFSYALVSRQAQRDCAEKYLYDRLKPLCNQNDPGGNGCPINLP